MDAEVPIWKSGRTRTAPRTAMRTRQARPVCNLGIAGSRLQSTQGTHGNRREEAYKLQSDVTKLNWTDMVYFLRSKAS